MKCQYSIESSLPSQETYLLPLLKLVQVVHAKVAHANTPDLTLLHGLHQGLPSTQSTLRALERRMEKVQIDVLEPRIL